MSLILAAMFVDCAHKAKEPQEALRALSNAWYCRDLSPQQKNEIIAIQKAIAWDHPEDSHLYGQALELIAEQEIELIRKCRKV